MRIAAFQMDVSWEDPDVNLHKIDEAASTLEPATLLVLPELCLTGFSMGAVERFAGRVTEQEEALRAIARKHGIAMVAGVMMVDSGTNRTGNGAVVITKEGEVAGRYLKMHPFPLVEEARYFVAGDSALLVRLDGVGIAPFVCYDLRFPEPFGAAAKAGAEVLVVIANWPETRHHHWRCLIKARAVENQAFVVAVNRTGADPDMNYLGGSAIIDPLGDLISDAGKDEALITAGVESDAVTAWRANFTALAERSLGETTVRVEEK